MLRDYAIDCGRESVLMQIRRLLDRGRRNEENVFSLHRALDEAGQGQLAQELRDANEHLLFLADKAIAHPKPLDADARVAEGLNGRVLEGNVFQPRMITNIVARMGDAYPTHVQPSAFRDAIPLFDDPLFDAILKKGLPSRTTNSPAPRNSCEGALPPMPGA